MMAGRQCVILVGGRGARLGALTQNCPKPLLAVGGRPFVSYLIQEAARHGFRRILLLAGFKAESFADELAALHKHAPGNVELSIVTEPVPLGTAGALKFAAARLDTHFLLLNGDSIFDVNLLDLAAPPFPAGIIGRLALKPEQDTARYGTVAFEDGYVRKFIEKNPASEPGLINGGVYWLSRQIVAHIADGFVSLENDVLPKLATGGHLQGTVYDRFMLDIGLPDTLQQAQSGVPARMHRPAVFFDRDGVLNKDVGYAHRSDQIVWIDGAIAAVKTFNDAGYYVFVVTNQAGVARGLYAEADVQALHFWMNDELARSGGHIDAFMYCPHHPQGTVAKYTRASQHRKPAPGMIVDLLNAWPIVRDRSFLIGDKDTDIAAAEAAGVRGYLYKGGNMANFARKCAGMREL